MLIYFEHLALLIILTTYAEAMIQPSDLFSSGPFARLLKYIQLSEKQRKNVFFCHKNGAHFTFYAKGIKCLSRLILELGEAPFISVDVLTRHKELYMTK